MSPFKDYSGLSLIELMITLLLTTLIMSGLAAVYLTAMKAHLAESGLQTIQENMRVSDQFFSSEIHLAGHLGCAKLKKEVPVASSAAYTITENNYIQVYQGSEIKPGTDAFTIRYAGAMAAALVETMTQANLLHVTASPKFSVGDSMLISDCKTAEIFLIQHISIASDGTQQIVTDTPLQKLYEEYTEISEFQINTFYIGKTSRKQENGAIIYALYKKDKNLNTTELVEGINAMKVLYISSNNDNLIEQKANEVKDWSSISAISLELHFVTLNSFPLEKISYLFVGIRERE